MNEPKMNAGNLEKLVTLPVRSDRSMGRLLLDAGKLKAQDIEVIERCQKERGLQFGEAAVKLGLADDTDILKILAQQFDYPYLQPGEGGFSEELVTAYQPFSPLAEKYRELRSQLMLRWFDGERNQLTLASVGQGEGCSHLAANLAVACSQLGGRTLLIDANLRHPRQHRLFNLHHGPGLSDFLAGRAGMEVICEIPAFATLSVLPAGTVPPNPQELLGRPAFSRLLKDLTGNYDHILLDTPSYKQCADTLHVVALTGAALLVMCKDHTRMNETLTLQGRIADTKAQIVGVALNEF